MCLKGKQEAVKIYRLISDRSQPLDKDTQEFLYYYNLGREAFLERKFSQAIREFEIAQKLQTNDAALNIHLERARTYLSKPPAKEWDGVHEMTTK